MNCDKKNNEKNNKTSLPLQHDVRLNMSLYSTSVCFFHIHTSLDGQRSPVVFGNTDQGIVPYEILIKANTRNSSRSIAIFKQIPLLNKFYLVI